MKYVVVFFILLPLFILAEDTSLKKGMIINRSVTIISTTYYLNAEPSFEIPLIVIEGKNITVDFNNAILSGLGNVTKPNKFHGFAILIKKGSVNIVLKNANIHGCKMAVLADSVYNLTIENFNFSYNYRQELHSTWQREDISDWLSFHHNENDEWLRYGTGIYLKHCNKATIKNNIVNNGQCGLLMTNCDSAEVFDNNFSFNSALGIGMYRSSYNHIYHNQLDFNVRGFSFGKYYRGQDSAGILVFEQCNNNVFAYNSVTHSGDGFFLWAGQYTMDTGEGGCNGNLIYNNDFSFAPTNGVEVTFSRNDIQQNIIEGCDNGIWGGYSYNTFIYNNQLRDNKTAIAIEHGQDNTILSNYFQQNKTSIKLWSREKQPADWGYAQKRNTNSNNYEICRNTFDSENLVYDIMGTNKILLAGNKKNLCNQYFKLGNRVSGLDTTAENGCALISEEFDSTDSKINFISKKGIPQNSFGTGRNQIRITEWGPYNFEYPVMFLDSISKGNYYFTILKKNGEAKLLSNKGFSVTSQTADKLIAKADSLMQDISVQLQYSGDAFTDMFGRWHEASKPYVFGYREFNPLALWKVNFYEWNEKSNPNKSYNNFINTLSSPVFTTTTKQIDYIWWSTIGKDLPADSFATIAWAVLNLPSANYEIGLTADDMAKLFIDGKQVINAWDKKFTELDENTHHSISIHLQGKHEFKIVHAENEGLADLVFYIKPEPQ